MKRIAELRISNGKTQGEIANILFCDRQVYARYESGKRRMPTSMIIKLAIYYNVSVDYLVELTDNPIPHKRTKE